MPNFDLGFQNAFGAQTASDSLERILARRFAEKQMAQRAQQEAFDNQFRNRQQNFNEQLRRDTLDENSKVREDALHESQRNHDLEAGNRFQQRASAMGDQVPADTFFADTPGNAPTIGMLRSTGLMKPQEARPRVDTGPLMPGDNGAERAQGFIKTASAKQLDTQADNDRMTANLARENSRDAETAHHNRAMENKPVSEQGWTLQQVTGPDGKPGWARMNSRTGQVVPVSTGDITAKQPQSLQVEAAHKQETLGALDQLDRSIDEASQFVGPGAGRVTSIEQMIGSADPRAQALGTKLLMAKMSVDKGMGGMRAAASPQLLARWDGLLSQKVTPEGLKASVQAMREILGGSAPAPAGNGAKLSAEDLIKKYGGGGAR